MRRDVLAFATLYAALAIGMFALNGWNAYNPTDDGFIFAYSWRIVSGEVPYRDFIFARMPLTPYLHAVWLALPDGWQIPAGRFAFYVELAAAAALPTLWLVRRLGLRAMLRPVALAVITFFLAVRAFPPMPWPTADGIFFGSAGATAFLLSLAKDWRWRAAASLLFALATLAKQSFVPLPVLLAVWALVEAVRWRSPRLLLASIAPGGVLAAATIAFLAAQDALPAFVQQLASTSQLQPSGVAPLGGDPVVIAFTPYLRSLGLGTVFLAIVAFALVYWRDREGRAAVVAAAVGTVILCAGLAWVAVEQLTLLFLAGAFQPFWILFGAAVAHALRARHSPVDGLLLAADASILLVSWCASLSFAAQSPILAMGAVGPLLDRGLPPTRWWPERPAILLASAIVMRSILFLNLEYPYRDVPRSEQVADLGEIYPRFGHLFTGRTNAQRFRELHDLSERYALSSGRAFVVVPDYPLIYYLTRQQNPLSLDWLQPQEYIGNEARLRRELVTRTPIVLLEREASSTYGQAFGPPPPCDRPPHPLTGIIQEILRWRLVAEGYFFCVYRALE